MDALCHAIESLWNVKSTEESREYAEKAIKLFCESKNGYITKRLKDQGYNIDEIRVRKLINHIRVNGLVNCLIATSKGYYRAINKDEICEYIASLKSREDAIRAVRRSLEKQAGL